MGPVQKTMGRTLVFFIALKHGANTFFFLQSPAMGRIHFSTILKPMRRYLQKDADAAISFTEIADSNLNAVAPRSVLEKKKV